MTWSRIQPPIQVSRSNTRIKMHAFIFTLAGQSRSQHPPAEAATDDHDRFGSIFK